MLSANKIWCPKFGKYLEGGLKVNLKSSGIVAASLKQFQKITLGCQQILGGFIVKISRNTKYITIYLKALRCTNLEPKQQK